MTLLELFCHIEDFCQTFQIPTPKLSLPVLDKAARLGENGTFRASPPIGPVRRR